MTEIEVQLSDQDLALLLLTGFVRHDPDGVLALTPKGSTWLREWCDKRLAEHAHRLEADVGWTAHHQSD